MCLFHVFTNLCHLFEAKQKSPSLALAKISRRPHPVSEHFILHQFFPVNQKDAQIPLFGAIERVMKGDDKVMEKIAKGLVFVKIVWCKTFLVFCKTFWLLL